MITIVNRDDLPPGLRKVPIEDIKLYHARLPIDTIQQAEIIVFYEECASSEGATFTNQDKGARSSQGS